MLTREQLRQQLHYDPETGVFTRLVSLVGHVAVGDVAGWQDKDGYFCISVLGEEYKAHRLAFLYMTGEWPGPHVDHRDLDPSNNRWANLRSSSCSQNHANRSILSTNTSGLKGVSWHKPSKRWRATTSSNNRQVYIGLFECPAAAHFAYIIKSDQLYGEFARAS